MNERPPFRARVAAEVIQVCVFSPYHRVLRCVACERSLTILVDPKSQTAIDAEAEFRQFHKPCIRAAIKRQQRRIAARERATQ